MGINTTGLSSNGDGKMKFTKSELWKRYNFRCSHSKNGLEHPRCFDRFQKERVFFLDIECSSLQATFGIVYTFVAKELGGKFYKGSITTEDLKNEVYDKNLLKECIKVLEMADRVVVHYGTDHRFDLPFLRTRAELFNLPFPEYKFCNVSDTYPILRNKFKLHSNRLETACDFFGIPSKGHRLNPKVWLRMLSGNVSKMQQSIKYILKHNIEDVVSLEALWLRISKYANMAKTSI